MIKKINLPWKTFWQTRTVKDRQCRRAMRRILTMTGSTTRLLEQLSGRRLQVNTEFQKGMGGAQEAEIVRMTRLHLGSADAPVILSISSLSPANLTEREIADIRGGEIPLGTIFCANGAKLWKSGICFKVLDDSRLARKLNVKDARLFSKEYILWTGNRRVGIIKEIFNQESIKRIWRS